MFRVEAVEKTIRTAISTKAQLAWRQTIQRGGPTRSPGTQEYIFARDWLIQYDHGVRIVAAYALQEVDTGPSRCIRLVCKVLLRQRRQVGL